MRVRRLLAEPSLASTIRWRFGSMLTFSQDVHEQILTRTLNDLSTLRAAADLSRIPAEIESDGHSIHLAVEAESWTSGTVKSIVLLVITLWLGSASSIRTECGPGASPTRMIVSPLASTKCQEAWSTVM